MSNTSFINLQKKYPGNWTLFKEFLIIFIVLTLTLITLLTPIIYEFSLMTVKIFFTFQRIFNDFYSV
jgi:hypothetical protein